MTEAPFKWSQSTRSPNSSSQRFRMNMSFIRRDSSRNIKQFRLSDFITQSLITSVNSLNLYLNGLRGILWNLNRLWSLRLIDDVHREESCWICIIVVHLLKDLLDLKSFVLSIKWSLRRLIIIVNWILKLVVVVGHVRWRRRMAFWKFREFEVILIFEKMRWVLLDIVSQNNLF